jgi:hypothetical protein
LLITKPFEFKAKLTVRFTSHKPTTVQFPNLYYAIPELKIVHFYNKQQPHSDLPTKRRKINLLG